MASTAISAQGSTLQVEGAVAGTADVLVGNLISYSGFDGESAEIDITNLSSTAKEVTAGLQDFGNFSGSWHHTYADAGQEKMRVLQASGATAAFLLTLKDGSTVDFDGVVKNASSIEGGVDAVQAGSFSISVSGEPTVTPA